MKACITLAAVAALMLSAAAVMATVSASSSRPVVCR